jgi:hypothetical protein
MTQRVNRLEGFSKQRLIIEMHIIGDPEMRKFAGVKQRDIDRGPAAYSVVDMHRKCIG